MGYPSLLAMSVLAQAEENPDFGGGGGGVAGILFPLFFVALSIFLVAAYWKLYEKAGQPGWGVLIPIYNVYLLCKIVGRPGWWTLLCFIPLVNIIIVLILCIDLAKVFGQGAGIGLGIFFLPL